MRQLFIMDPIETVAVDLDSTFALMLEAQRRGHDVLYGRIEDLYQRDSVACCDARPVTVQPVQGDHARLGDRADIPLGDVDVVWMRKDPPFDMAYVFATYLLDLAPAGTLVVNHPAGLRSVNEKAWIQHYPDLIPESVTTQRADHILDFVNQHGVGVIKPLDGNGGAGVFLLRANDPNIGVIIEISTHYGARKVLVQRYLPEAKDGDKRIILVEGEAVGACNRVPTGVDHRGNIHVGARVEASPLDARDLEICRAIGPALAQAGQVFVGIDVIGGLLTEVNVTSPTCIHEINRFDHIAIEAMLLDAVETRLSAL